MVSQAPVVGILMIIYGVVNSLLGIALAIGLPTLLQFAQMNQPQNNPGDKEAMAVLSVVYAVSGVIAIVCGILNIVGGIRVMKFRGRTLAIVALFSNVSACIGGCWLFGLAVMIYGLIVLFNADVARAFRMGEEGVDVDTIKRKFASRYYDRDDDDFDDDRDDRDDDDDDRPPSGSRDSGNSEQGIRERK